ncbi:hypothetical protein C8J56DRAFT_1046557 [Mycena floridula]|nr:hypothetical protein C8J56DRAFT_1046557 [Mycena floridula]
MKVFIWILRESGAREVPSLYALCKTQKSFHQSTSSGVTTIPCTSVCSNVFHMNDPRSIVTMDWNNPLVCSQIHVYPEIPPNGVVLEIWHTEKWQKDMDLSLLSPMYDAGASNHFYINEVAMLKSPVLLIPRPCATAFVISIRWVMYKGKVHADTLLIYLNGERHATVDAKNTYLISAEELECNFLTLQDRGLIPIWSEQAIKDGHPARMPNPDRKIANGAPFYTSFPGPSCDKETILTEVKRQIKLSCQGIAAPIKEAQTDTSVKDAFTQYWIKHILKWFKTLSEANNNQTESDITAELLKWVDENYEKIFSPFLMLKGLDPTKDTPVEILHTILLTNVFHVHDLVDDKHFTVWKAVGELGALLWYPEIDNMDQYCRDLRVAVANVLDGFAEIDPSKMVMKIKLHLLTHLPDNAQAFGPLVGVATEVYKAFNGVFCFASILSNHISPSQDIAIQLADQEGLKHQANGGWWNVKDDAAEPEWKQAGPGV